MMMGIIVQTSKGKRLISVVNTLNPSFSSYYSRL